MREFPRLWVPPPAKAVMSYNIYDTAFFQGALLPPAGHVTIPPPPRSRVPVPGSSRCDLSSFSLASPTPVDLFFAQNAAF